MFILLQMLFYFILTLLTGFLVIEGWLTKSVWVKGCSKGLLASITEMDAWAVKKYRNSEPDTYWIFMGFYAVAFLFFLAMIVF